MDATHCANCGMEVPAGTEFCPNCGAGMDNRGTHAPAGGTVDGTRIASGGGIPAAPAVPVPTAAPSRSATVPPSPTLQHKTPRKMIVTIIAAVAALAAIGAGIAVVHAKKNASALADARERCTSAVERLEAQRTAAETDVRSAEQLETLSASEVADEDTLDDLHDALDRYRKISGDKSALSCPTDAGEEELERVAQQAQSDIDASKQDLDAIATAAESVRVSQQAQQKADAKADEQQEREQAQEQARNQERTESASDSKSVDRAGSSANADGGEDIEGDWLSYPKDGMRTYANARFDFTAQIPEDFALVTPGPANGDGRAFTDDATGMRITASASLGNTTAQQMLDMEKREHHVSYSLVKDDVMIATWEENGTVTYERMIIGPKAVSTIRFTYPKENQAVCGPIVERTAPTLTAPYTNGGV